MSFGGDPSLSHQTEEQRVAQWLWQIRDEQKREQARQELAPVLDREHFHVEALERIEEQEEGYTLVRPCKVLAMAVFKTVGEVSAARERIVVGGMICHGRQCFGEDCGPKQEEDDDGAV